MEAYVEEMTSGDTISTVNIQKDRKSRIKALYEGVVRLLRRGPDQPHQRHRDHRSSSQFLRPQVSIITSISADKMPFFVKLPCLERLSRTRTLLTSVSKGPRSGGAHVVITTSRYSRSTVEYYQDIYRRFGARGSALTVVPFNQGSKQDVEVLVDYIYATLGMDLDYILPFAAVPENGREIDSLDNKLELAHQSKISLETLFNRWNSKSWGEYLCLAGAVIGWTRSMGLMDATNIFAREVEAYGVHTFSAKKMAFNILGLMHPLLFSITQVEPIWADLNGGIDRLPDLTDITTRIRMDLNKKSELCRAIARDNALDFKVINGAEGERALRNINVVPRANFKFDPPTLEPASAFEELSKSRGIIDSEKVIVMTGFAEVGPWHSSQTQWEMEARGEFTIEGCIDMARIMGSIKHFDSHLKDSTLHVGWVDAKTGEPVDDKDVRSRYEKEILSHAGVHLIGAFPELFRGYDPKKVFNQEIELIHDRQAKLSRSSC
ncbi:hypothetical protein BKA82DRAFT_4452370 [Pisolithus tinctorius]|nr:hypothetical protein BKA82DRAFT_4452370 [Pisolithus tinctorius]